MEPQIAALIGAVVILSTGSTELVKYVVSKRNGRNGNGSFTADDREKLTEIRLYMKQSADQHREQTLLLREMTNEIKVMAMKVQG